MENERPVSSRPMLVLSYLAFLGVVPLLFAKRDSEIRWHARNGLLLFGAVVGIAIAATLVGTLLPALGCLYATLMFFVLALYAFIAILAIVKALDGQRLLVPGISRYAGRS
ncbi:MAG: hypothetical protein DMF54_04590 [Acidobacteria bacterium]|nr:MAG: hypothetical protein DMF55_09500 [Acidobacteriota bacterium]PYQ67434.1 MAG: hypothetical protein DMF54_04590 [Acidobacteriota bacterium]